MEKVWSSLDVYLAVWIYLLTGNYPDLKFYNGKVSFNYPLTDDVVNAIDKYHSGGMIAANKYSITIKSFKSQIFQMKENREI